MQSPESGGGPLGSDTGSRALYDLLTRVEEGFESTQQHLRERVLSVSSTDGRLKLKINGEGLAINVQLEPTLLADGAATVEKAVMEAVNNAVLAIHELTTEAFRAATEQHLGIAVGNVAPPTPSCGGAALPRVE